MPGDHQDDNQIATLYRNDQSNDKSKIIEQQKVKF